ncbi:MAG TPA: hypothetical protein VGH34_21050 [Vicinamibacterales bacterium]
MFISGAGSDIWGSADSFHFVYQSMQDGSISSNAPSLQSTSPFAKIGLMVRLTLDPGSPEVILDVKPDNTVEFMARSTANGETTFITGLDHTGGLALVRSNGMVAATVCAATCSTLGTVPFPSGPAFVGAAITSHDPTQLNHGMFPAAMPAVFTVPTPWQSVDVGSVGVQGSAFFQNNTFTVSGAGADIWGTSDAYHIVASGVEGANVLIDARVTSEDAADTFAKAGVVLTNNFGATVILDVRPNGDIEFMSRPARGEPMQFVAGATASLPIWLELTRQGDTFTGYFSTDGTHLSVIGSTSVFMPNDITAGLAVSSHDTSALNTSAFDHVLLLNSNVSDLDIGVVGAGGGTSGSGGEEQIQGSGSDIWGTEDSFHYRYNFMANDGQMQARVTSLENTSPLAKAGIMMRSSADPWSAHVLLDVKPDGGIEFMTRSTNGAETTFVAGVQRSFPVSLQLQRSGSSFTAYVVDGTQLTEIGSVTIDLPSEVFVGLAVSSHDVGTRATGVFDGIRQ